MLKSIFQQQTPPPSAKTPSKAAVVCCELVEGCTGRGCNQLSQARAEPPLQVCYSDGHRILQTSREEATGRKTAVFATKLQFLQPTVFATKLQFLKPAYSKQVLKTTVFYKFLKLACCSQFLKTVANLHDLSCTCRAKSVACRLNLQFTAAVITAEPRAGAATVVLQPGTATAEPRAGAAVRCKTTVYCSCSLIATAEPQPGTTRARLLQCVKRTILKQPTSPWGVLQALFKH